MGRMNKDRIYGYSLKDLSNAEVARLNELPEDGFDDILSMEEVRRYFPNQHVVVCALEYEGVPAFFSKGRVVKYHCDLVTCMRMQSEYANYTTVNTFQESEDIVCLHCF